MKSLTGWQDDLDLVQGLRQGEAGAVEALVARHGPWIYRLALRLTGQPPDAEEVAQDALLRVVQKIDTFKGEAAFTSWVYRIAANLAYQKLRGRPPRDVSIDDFLPVFDEQGGTPRWSPTGRTEWTTVSWPRRPALDWQKRSSSCLRTTR